VWLENEQKQIRAEIEPNATADRTPMNRRISGFSVYVAPIATCDRPAAADWEYGEIERFSPVEMSLESR